MLSISLLYCYYKINILQPYLLILLFQFLLLCFRPITLHYVLAKCIKCNGPHKSEHHREFGWCCKANPKINPPRLETKKGEPCPHSFKCLNCRSDHQADSNLCLFWRHRFNREWHLKKYAEIRVNRFKSTHSEVNGSSPQ